MGKCSLKEFFRRLFGGRRDSTSVVDRFPTINTLRELSVYAKNSATGADDAYVESQILEQEIKTLVSQISKLRTPADADEATREQLTIKRAELRVERDKKERQLSLCREKGKGLEKAADEYAYLLFKATGKEQEFRKAARFADPNIDITNAELKAFLSKIN